MVLVLLVDEPLARCGLRALLDLDDDLDDDLEVIAEATNGSEALDLVRLRLP
ncbi:response regulator [Streptomyces sp. NPDC001591]|uniref:hypothetical protein n=1 Tax=Streptomyces sp. NPDC001591 TaxID=3364589 RepID=UPI0036964948